MRNFFVESREYFDESREEKHEAESGGGEGVRGRKGEGVKG